VILSPESNAIDNIKCLSTLRNLEPLERQNVVQMHTHYKRQAGPGTRIATAGTTTHLK